MEPRLFPGLRAYEIHPLKFVERMIRFGGDPFDFERTLSKIGSMEEWFTRWFEAGTRWERDAKAEVTREHHNTASQWFLQAALSYRIGEFLIAGNTDEKVRGHERFMDCFQGYTETIKPSPKRVEISFEGGTLPAILQLTGAERRPCVIALTGSDGCKEELYLAFSLYLAQRGLTTLLLDGPGQGEALISRGLYLRPDFEKVVGATIDFLSNVDGVDDESLGVLGSSMGGHFALRAAAFDSRIKACMCLSVHYSALEYIEEYPSLHAQRKYILGVSSMEEVRERFKSFTLDGIIDRVKCPVMIYHGKQDRITPVSQAEKVYELLNTEKEMKVVEDGTHNCGNYDLIVRPMMCDWFSDKLG